jgi:hypothetical protein
VLLEQIDRPAPAVGGFNHHVAALGGLGHFLGEPDRVIVDSDAVDLFSLPGPSDRSPNADGAGRCRHIFYPQGPPFLFA